MIEQGLTKVCLSGGDPFSKPDSWEIIDYLYQKGIATDIYTNGQRLINDVERLANYFPRTVEISIYSGDADTHDAITRINGSWQKAISVIKNSIYSHFQINRLYRFNLFFLFIRKT